jgi:tetraacyldisaccharide 4'-kinase
VAFQDGDRFLFPEKVTTILLFTGIADNYPLKEYLERKCSELVTLRFSDHHPYTEKDLDFIIRKFEDLPTQKKVLVTSEKDVMRLKTPEFCTKFRNIPLFYVPIEIDFHGNDKEQFNNEVLAYVEKTKRNH